MQQQHSQGVAMRGSLNPSLNSHVPTHAEADTPSHARYGIQEEETFQQRLERLRQKQGLP